MPRQSSHCPYALCGTATTQLVGGLQVCLDLSSAFDRVPWEHLDTALALAGLPDHLRHRLMHWLEDSEYCIHASSQSRIIKLGRGVKQGCRTSPILFSAYTALICRRIDEKLGRGWSARHLTIYADDFHVGFVVHGLEQLKKRLRETHTVMRVIEEMGVALNPSKAAAIVTFRGSQRAQASAHCILSKGGHRLLGVGTGRERIFIPVTQTTKYLGAQISYGDFETATLEYRLRQGRVRYWQLVSILNSKQSMTAAPHCCMEMCHLADYELWTWGIRTFHCKLEDSTKHCHEATPSYSGQSKSYHQGIGQCPVGEAGCAKSVRCFTPACHEGRQASSRWFCVSMGACLEGSSSGLL